MSAYRDEDFMSAFMQNDANVSVPDPIWIKISHNGGSGYIIDVSAVRRESVVTVDLDYDLSTRIVVPSPNFYASSGVYRTGSTISYIYRTTVYDSPTCYPYRSIY